MFEVYFNKNGFQSSGTKPEVFRSAPLTGAGERLTGKRQKQSQEITVWLSLKT